MMKQNMRIISSNAAKDGEIDELQKQLAESRFREKTSIRDLEEIATGADVCGYCKNTGEQCELCGVPVQDDTSPSNFEWRGPQEGRNERNGKV
jgi:ornithine cyclodeaminase/alanine dehydrogenase-like protein (mu-crystallin family)